MTSSGLLNTREALEILGLWNPVSGTKPNHRYLKYLELRGLLTRIKLGSRTIVYKKSDCEKLFKMACEQGLQLTTKVNAEKRA